MNRTILFACASSLTLMGCTSDPLAPRPTHTLTRSIDLSSPTSPVPSRFREGTDEHPHTPASITDTPSTPDEFVRLALYRSPELERAYQQWVAMGERVTQAGVLPEDDSLAGVVDSVGIVKQADERAERAGCVVVLRLAKQQCRAPLDITQIDIIAKRHAFHSRCRGCSPPERSRVPDCSIRIRDAAPPRLPSQPGTLAVPW